MSNCIFCERIPKLLKEKNPFLVNEFKHSVLVVGDHQTFPGYCVLILKNHVKELFDLDISTQIEFHQELITASRGLAQIFSADKMNISSYGNVTPHLHWHLFPRKKSDVNWPEPPWSLMKDFEKNKTSIDEAKKVSELLREYFREKYFK